MKLKINGLKAGNTNVEVRGAADGGEEVSKIIPIIVKSGVEVYNPGISSYDELVEGGVLPDIGSENPTKPIFGGDSEFFVPFQVSSDGILTISGMDGVNNFNGVYTPEPGKWRNPNLEPIRYTGDNGNQLVLRYVKSEIYRNVRADINTWDIQIINKMKWSSSSRNPSFAGNHISMLTYASLRWGNAFSTDDTQRPFRPTANEVYYTQEVKDAQGDDSWLILINASSCSDTFKANPNLGPFMLYPNYTEEQKAWNTETGMFYYGATYIKIPDMNVIPKGIHRISFGERESDTFFTLVLHKEI